MSKWGRYWARKRLHENTIDDKTKEILMKIYDYVMNDGENGGEVKNEPGNIEIGKDVKTSP